MSGATDGASPEDAVESRADAMTPAAPESAIDAATRAQAVAEARRLIVEESLSANEATARVAVPLGVSARTVSRWAAGTGQSLGQLSQDAAKTRTAHAVWRARGGYTATRRLLLADKLLAAIESQVDMVEPADLSRLTMAFAIASDKRSQLEDRAAEHAALADPTFWAWLTAERRRDPVETLVRASPVVADAEPVTPARYHLVAAALTGVGGPGPGDAEGPAGFSARPVTRRPRPGPEVRAGQELAALRNGDLPLSRRMRAAAALADAGWGPAPDGEDGVS